MEFNRENLETSIRKEIGNKRIMRIGRYKKAKWENNP